MNRMVLNAYGLFKKSSSGFTRKNDLRWPIQNSAHCARREWALVTIGWTTSPVILQLVHWYEPLFWVLCETTPFRRSQGFNVIPLNMFFPANCFLRFGNNLYKGWHGGAGGKPGWLLEPEGMQSIQIDLCSHIDQEHETLLSNKHK